jgi:hypothetical protein
VRYIVSAMLLAAALIHVLPLSGVLGTEQLAELYGISVTDHNLEVLMRHRAVLFGLLGALLASAAFIPALQLTAFIAGFVSVSSFLVIAWRVGGYNAQLSRVFAVDLVAIVCLAIGLVAYAYSRR